MRSKIADFYQSYKYIKFFYRFKIMKIVNTLQHYVKFDYKTFVVDNYVLVDPSEVDEVLQGEYVYKDSKLFKALKNTVSSLNNLKDEKIFLEIPEYSDMTPKKDEISKKVQSSETKDTKEVTKVEEVEQVEEPESTDLEKDVKSKKKR